MELTCEPVFDYGRVPARWSVVEAATGPTRPAPRLTIRLQTNMAVGVEGDRVRGRHVLTQGEQMYCSLSWAEELAAPESVDEANEHLAATARFWRGWLGRARIPDHRWRDPIQRSALAIKGLTYMPTGATVAALTTSLPETPGGERNWDYRYTWLRDSTFTLQALHYLNLDWEAEEFMQFVADLEPNDDGAPADHVRDRRPARSDTSRRARTSPATPGRAPCGSATAPTTSARTTSTARRWTRSSCTPAAASACRGGCGRSCRRRPSARPRSGASPTRASGRPAASPSTTSPPSSCAGWRWIAQPSSRRYAATGSSRGKWRATAQEIKEDILTHGLSSGRGPAPALRDRRAGRLQPAGRDLRLPARHRRAPARERPGDRRRSDRGRLRPALPHR